jgi:hypothetical protein
MIFAEGELKLINDIMEIDNFILAVGDNMIESFFYSNGQLVRGKFAINDTSNTEILCITFNPMSKLFFCGHKSGSISAWVPSEATFLAIQDLSKIHDGVIIR